MPAGLSRRISSAYGTHDAGRRERIPVVGGEYGCGISGEEGDSIVVVSWRAEAWKGTICRGEHVANLSDRDLRAGRLFGEICVW